MASPRSATLLLTAGFLLTSLAPPGATGPAVSWQPGRNDYTIAMSDNASIDATLWVPSGTAPDAKLPAIIVIHGYGGSKEVSWARRAAERGYVGFAYSTRGFGQSTGQMDVAGPRSIQDLKELVVWLKANGPVDPARVGVTGASYGGGHSFQIATHPDAGVATVVPIVGWTDLGQALRPNGVFKFSYTTGYYVGGNGLVQSGNQPVPLSVGGIKVSRRQLYDTYALEVHGGYAGLVAGVGQGTYEQYFRERSAALGVDNIRIPIFVIQGLSDDLFPADQVLPFFQLIPTAEKKLYLGFVGHPRASGSGPEVDAAFQQVYRWFDHYLKGLGAKPFDPARPIEVASTPWDGTTLQLGMHDWPGGSSGQPWALNADGSLGPPAAPGVGAVSNTWVAGVHDDAVITPAVPALRELPNSTPADTLAFTSAPLAQPMEMLGTPRAELRLRATSPSFQVAVKVFDQGPSGSVMVTRGIWGVDDNVPGGGTRVIFDLQPYRHTFQAGHQIEVRVAASDFPMYLPEKNPFTLVLDLGEGGSLVRLPLRPVA